MAEYKNKMRIMRKDEKMVNLIFIGGTMGVGKSETGEYLKHKLDDCVFLDGDWCWNSSPFVVNDNMKKYMLDNISHLLCNYIDCGEFKNIVFVWVMHEQEIIDTLLKSLGEREYNFFNFSLVCSADTLRTRLLKDIIKSKRDSSVIERSIPRLQLYEKIDSIKINTDNLSAEKTADGIIRYLKEIQ